MAASRDAPTAEPLSAQQQADILLNRTNVALARSQRLIRSWLPASVSQDSITASAQGYGDEDEEEEEDWKGESETGGLGSRAAAAGDTGLADGALQRKKLSSNDKLLEQLLGRKVAQARKKEQAAAAGRKSMAGAKHAAPKSLPPVEKAGRIAADSEDEEGAEEEMQRMGKAGRAGSRPGRGAGVSYLDELLAQNADKKKRKKERRTKE